jgi:hypothetical protein
MVHEKEAPAATISIEKLGKSWLNDPLILEAFFELCVRNWKEWSGRKPTEVVPKVNGTYLQATHGDCTTPAAAKGVEESASMVEWRRLKGTDMATAKRRFITLLRSIDQGLLRIKARPVGYVLCTRDGQPICPWSNTGRGCPMDLLDKDGTPLRGVIERDMQSLKDPATFRRWVVEHEQHQCELGAHMPLIRLEVRAYLPWFEQKICGGFVPYTFKDFRRMVRGIVNRQAAHFQALMDDSKKYTYREVEVELDALVSLALPSLSSCTYAQQQHDRTYSRDAHRAFLPTNRWG